MTTGQQWQFRPYKWSEPRILFHHGKRLQHQCLLAHHVILRPVKGIYVSWTNDPPNHKIKDWNVTELKVRFSSFCALL